MPPTEALGRVVDWLRCPTCRQPVALAGPSLLCGGGHTFDVARQGYVNLLGRAAPANADTPQMLAARDRFLSAGHYAPIGDAVATALAGCGRLLEVGAGTGHYAAAALDRSPGALGLASDVSPAAARRAARAHPRLASVVADTWAGLPVADQSVDAVLCVFAPRNPAEFARVLRPGGRTLVVVPEPDHLQELRSGLGLLEVDPAKEARLREAFAGWETEGPAAVRFHLDLDASAAGDLVAMGPNAFHGGREAVAARVTVSVSCWEFHPA